MEQMGVHAYRKTDVITADPRKLVILCYEAAIRNLQVAKAKFLTNEYEARAKAIQNTLDIISELRGALNFEKGGEIATNLDALYRFWTAHILMANRRRDLIALEQVVAMLEDIKSALEEAYYGQRNAQAIPAASLKPQFDPVKEKNTGYSPGLLR